VISGGQSGSDQGGLEAAEKAGLKRGGYIPNGFVTEDGSDPDLARRHNLIETSSPFYPPRTYANARWADGTIRFAKDFTSPGEVCTLNAITLYKKPWIDVNIENPRPVSEVVNWLRENKIETLNVAGNRESTAPGIHDFVVEYLGKVFAEVLK
jgi:hypothetical protein